MDCVNTHINTRTCVCVFARECVCSSVIFPRLVVCVCVCTTMDRNIFRSNASSDPNRPTLSELKGFALDVRY